MPYLVYLYLEKKMEMPVDNPQFPTSTADEKWMSPVYSGKVKPKILIVDDRTENLIALKKVLAELDVELIEASSGNEALQLTLRHTFALALLDVQMPDMDGYELAEILRSEPETAYIPIIFISAIFTDRLNVFIGFEHGAFSFITKPFEPIELLNKVRFFISKYHTEQAFADSRKKYMDLYHSSPDMLASIDIASMTIVECNQTLLEQTGFSREELINKPFTTLYDKASAEVVTCLFANYEAKGEIENIELTLVTKQGEKLNVLFTCNGITDLDGKLIYSNSSLRNISELKEARQQLERTLTDLQTKNDELENLVYITSHDLQEPMHTVISSVKLIEEKLGRNLDSDSRSFLDYSIVSADRMRVLITGMLNYLRIGNDKDYSPVDLNEVVQDVVKDLGSHHQPVELEFISDDLPKNLIAKRDEMYQLFYNVVDNAIKFRKPDIKPEISVKFEEDEQGILKFSISDNGIGIDQIQLKKCFKIFKQLHDRGKYTGTGMGLAASKKIVKSMGGEIWIESEESDGTTLYFTLRK